MPVVSPSRFTSTSSSLSGTYRSSLTPSSSLDKPYYRTSSSGTYVTSTLRSSYGDRTTEYRTRYSDVDGKRERKSSLVEYSRSSRAPSVTDSDSGISTRYRSERSESRGRDISTSRSENGKANGDKKRNAISSSALAMSTAELYNKYSPANYIPLTQRLQMQQQQQNQNYNEISRSKSISSDIGRPPAADSTRYRKTRPSATITERADRRYKETSPSPSYTKRTSLTNGVKDSNGNEVPTVSEIRKRFDQKMTVTKLPANDRKNSVEHYLNQIKDCENGTVGYKVLQDDKPAPIHLPYEKNGISKWDGSRSSSISDLTVTKTVVLPIKDRKERIANIKSQLDPNNPIGKILEKSTVIHVENGETPESKVKDIKSDIEKQVKTPHTSNFASYIQISQPISSGSTPKKEINGDDVNIKSSLKYIDSEEDKLDVEVESPSSTGFENKTFEHENFLKNREIKKEEDGVKSMETSTESTLSEDSSPETPSSKRRVLEKNADEELAGGKSGGSLRRSSERAELSSARTEPKPSHSSGLNGLRNIGNTCFMNSVIQCLSNTKPLLEYLTEDKYSGEINTTLSCMKGTLIKAFGSVIKELWRSGEKDSVVNTTSLKSQVQRFAPRFMGYSQQDAQEFLRYLLEGLHEDVNRVTVRPKPILTEIDDNLSDAAKAQEAWNRYIRMEDSRIADIFMGQLKSTLRCTHCNHDSVTFDAFWDLSLPIPSRTGNLKLQQCLQHFTREEELDGDEKPTCSKCGVRRKCLKWFTVQKFPQILVLHLKRFSPTERFRGKLSVPVEFPLAGLDMAAFASGSQPAAPNYSLYAVSNHSGTTYSGHYTAYCKHPYTGDWHEYNDSRVTPINPRNVVSPEAYVLFYELNRGSHSCKLYYFHNQAYSHSHSALVDPVSQENELPCQKRLEVIN